METEKREPKKFTEGTFYKHFTIPTNGAVTLAARIIPSDSKEKNFLEVKIGCAFCSPQDKFSRERGRAIALGRINAEDRNANVINYFHISDSITSQQLYRMFIEAMQHLNSVRINYATACAYSETNVYPEPFVPRWFSFAKFNIHTEKV